MSARFSNCHSAREVGLGRALLPNSNSKNWHVLIMIQNGLTSTANQLSVLQMGAAYLE
ncbi:hypothetical protein N644_2509 [Lactiplantibacillus paraplantarum]|nr:hypothetical protein N644_2509 [Lactiplantibacillus paraplantarum]